MTLHIINKASSAIEINEQLSNAIEDGDSVLLIEDGVFQCVSPSKSVWPSKAKQIHALKEDALARGVRIPSGHIEIDYDGFVKLTTEHNKVVSWY